MQPGDPRSRQHPSIGAIFERQPQRTWSHFGRAGRRAHFVEHDRKGLTLACRLALHVDEMRRMGYRLEHDHEFCRQLQGKERPFARRQLDLLQGELVDHLLEGVPGQIDARALEDLTKYSTSDSSSGCRQRSGALTGSP